MKFSSTLFLRFGVCALLFWGCQYDDGPPRVEQPMLNFKTENITVEAPSTLRFDGLFSDGDRLDSLEIRIEPLFSAEAGRGVLNSHVPFFFHTKTPIGGRRSALTREIEIPTTAAEGAYLFTAGFENNRGMAGDSVKSVRPPINQMVNAFSPRKACSRARQVDRR